MTVDISLPDTRDWAEWDAEHRPGSSKYEFKKISREGLSDHWEVHVGGQMIGRVKKRVRDDPITMKAAHTAWVANGLNPTMPGIDHSSRKLAAADLHRQFQQSDRGERMDTRYDTGPLGTGKNWVTKTDPVAGVGPFIRAIAHALIRNGHPEGEAIAIAIGTCKRWAAGGGKVTPKTRAKAGAAIAEWEALKAANKGRKTTKGRHAASLDVRASGAFASGHAFEGNQWTGPNAPVDAATAGQALGGMSPAQVYLMASAYQSAMGQKVTGIFTNAQLGALKTGLGANAAKAAATSMKQAQAAIKAAQAKINAALAKQQAQAKAAAAKQKAADLHTAALNKAMSQPVNAGSLSNANTTNGLSPADRVTLSKSGQVPPSGFKWGGPAGNPTLVPATAAAQVQINAIHNQAATAKAKATAAATAKSSKATKAANPLNQASALAAASVKASARPATKSTQNQANAINRLTGAARVKASNGVPPAGFMWDDKNPAAPVLVLAKRSDGDVVHPKDGQRNWAEWDAAHEGWYHDPSLSLGEGGTVGEWAAEHPHVGFKDWTPEAKEHYGVEQWVAGDHKFKNEVTNPTGGDNRNAQAARHFTKLVEANSTVHPELQRGLGNMSDEDKAKFTEGKNVTLPVSSWTDKADRAESFADGTYASPSKPRPSSGVVLHVANGKGWDIGNHPAAPVDEHEVVASGGTFHVDHVTKSASGVTHVHLIPLQVRAAGLNPGDWIEQGEVTGVEEAVGRVWVSVRHDDQITIHDFDPSYVVTRNWEKWDAEHQDQAAMREWTKHYAGRGQDTFVNEFRRAEHGEPIKDQDPKARMAHRLYDLIKTKSTPQEAPLHRGLVVDAADADRLFKSGTDVDMPMSSFSVRPTVANMFASTSDKGKRGVILHVASGAKGLDISSAGKYVAEKEVISGGRLHVDSTEPDDAGHLVVNAHQVDATSRAQSNLPEWYPADWAPDPALDAQLQAQHQAWERHLHGTPPDLTSARAAGLETRNWAKWHEEHPYEAHPRAKKGESGKVDAEAKATYEGEKFAFPGFDPSIGNGPMSHADAGALASKALGEKVRIMVPPADMPNGKILAVWKNGIPRVYLAPGYEPSTSQVLHEAAHLIVGKKTGEQTGHTADFRTTLVGLVKEHLGELQANKLGHGYSQAGLSGTRAVGEFAASGPGTAASYNNVDASGAGNLLPNGPPKAPKPRVIKHRFQGPDLNHCQKCGQPVSAKVHVRSKPASGTRAIGPSDEGVDAMKAQATADQEALIPGIDVSMKSFFARQAKATIARLTGKRGKQMLRRAKSFSADTRADDALGPPPPAAVAVGAPATISPAVDPSAIFDDTFWTAQLATLLNEHYKLAATKAAGTINQQLGITLGPDETSALYKIDDILTARAQDQGWQVNQTTKNAIFHALSDGVQNGDSIPGLAAAVQQVFDQADKNRSILIARTEAVGSLNQAASAYLNALPDTTADRKIWLSHHDDRTRPTHLVADGQIVQKTEPFIVGGSPMMEPGDKAAPIGEWINCRCGLGALPPGVTTDHIVNSLDGLIPASSMKALKAVHASQKAKAGAGHK